MEKKRRLQHQAAAKGKSTGVTAKKERKHYRTTARYSDGAHATNSTERRYRCDA